MRVLARPAIVNAELFDRSNDLVLQALAAVEIRLLGRNLGEQVAYESTHRDVAFRSRQSGLAIDIVGQ